MNNNKICVGKYIPPYEKDYFKQAWFERDLMTYIDYLRYPECVRDPDVYFKRVNVVYFDFIHNKCRGDPLKKSMREHDTVYKNDFVDYSAKAKKPVISAALRNKHEDIWVQRYLMIEHFKKFS